MSHDISPSHKSLIKISSEGECTKFFVSLGCLKLKGFFFGCQKYKIEFKSVYFHKGKNYQFLKNRGRFALYFVSYGQ